MTAACPSKKKVRESFQEAAAAALRCSRRGRPLRVYRCDLCPGWHLTSRVRPARPERSR